MPKRQNADSIIQNQQSAILPASSKRHRANPELASLEVIWRPKDRDKPTEPKFSITVRVETSEACNQLEIKQFVMDGMSIKSGPPDPHTLSYRRDTWMADFKDINMNNTTSGEYEDNPGYDPSYLITAQTDFKYIFGAYWEVYINSTLVASTKSKPLFGLIKGRHPRVYKPDSEVVATWDLQHKHWVNSTGLKDHFPRWWTYPTPAVDNENTTYKGK